MIYTLINTSQTAFSVQGTKLVHAFHYAESLGGRTAKVVVELPGGKTEYYFLKVFSDTDMADSLVIEMLV
jgi:hypothetical protein